MKLILAFVLLLVILGTYCKADYIKEPKVIATTQYYTIYCVENYKWLRWNGTATAPQQMFEIHRYRTSVEVVSLPVSCN